MSCENIISSASDSCLIRRESFNFSQCLLNNLINAVQIKMKLEKNFCLIQQNTWEVFNAWRHHWAFWKALEYICYILIKFYCFSGLKFQRWRHCLETRFLYNALQCNKVVGSKLIFSPAISICSRKWLFFLYLKHFYPKVFVIFRYNEKSDSRQW